MAGFVSATFANEMDSVVESFKRATVEETQIETCKKIFCKCFAFGCASGGVSNTSMYIDFLFEKYNFIDILRIVLSEDNQDWGNEARSACMSMVLSMINFDESIVSRFDSEFLSILLEENDNIVDRDGKNISDQIAFKIADLME